MILIFTFVVAPEVADHILIAVVEPDAHPVPKLIVFVVAVAVAFAKKFAVIAVVGVPHIVYVVAAANSVTVVAVASNTDRVADQVVILVVIIGDVNVSVVPFVVAPVTPQNAPALLYCNCVEDHPGVHPLEAVGCMYSANQFVPPHHSNSYQEY